MLLFKEKVQLKKYLDSQLKQGKKIGFVPTMGALHKGHLSLIEKSKKDCHITVCSIFVNPTQFNNKEDFEKYPITIENDIFLLETHFCDVLFLPSVDEMYVTGLSERKEFDLGFIETVFEGSKRPGHFNGVCTIVEKLLNIVEPNILYLGQKDYQQCIVIKTLLTLMQKSNEIEVKICPTSREENGLAMSSRNKRLNKEEFDKAKVIYKNLLFIKNNLTNTNAKEVLSVAQYNIINAGFSSIDYLSIANANTLAPLNDFDDKTKTVILFAGFISNVRLIDNLLIN